MTEPRHRLEVEPRIPAPLARLADLAENLLYSWDRSVRGLFYRIDPAGWERSAHNPKVFLRQVTQARHGDPLAPSAQSSACSPSGAKRIS